MVTIAKRIDCLRCEEEAGVAFNMRHMIVCVTCGNKRCPRATDHRLACSGSNEPGQPGSAYTHTSFSGHPALAQLAERRSCAEATGPSPVGGHCPEVYRSELPTIDREAATDRPPGPCTRADCSRPADHDGECYPLTAEDAEALAGWHGLYSIARALKPDCLRELTEIATAYASANAADRATLLGVARMVSK